MWTLGNSVAGAYLDGTKLKCLMVNCVSVHTQHMYLIFCLVSSGTDPAISDASDFCATGTRLLCWVTVRYIRFPWTLNAWLQPLIVVADFALKHGDLSSQ